MTYTSCLDLYKFCRNCYDYKLNTHLQIMEEVIHHFLKYF